MVDLGIAGWRAPVHSHIAYLWETEQDFAEAVGFLAAGLGGSDHCLIVGDRADNDRTLAILKRRGIDNGIRKRLTVLERTKSAEQMLSRVTEVFEAALATGARLVRLFGTTRWDRPDGAPDSELFSFEARLNDLAGRFPCVILCVHELNSLTGFIIRRGVLDTHPQLLKEEGVLGNPLFVPFDRFLGRLGEVSVELSKGQAEREKGRREREILEAIFDNIPVMISFYNASGQLLLVNREWQRTLGWSLEQIRESGMDLFAEIFPDPGERQRALDFLAASTGEWADFKLEARNGRTIDVTWASVRLSDGTTVTINQDITERKRAEEQVRESQQLLQLVLATLPVGVVVIDHAGDIVLTNAASKRIWGDTIESGRERWARSKGFWHDSGKRIAPADWASVRALSEGQTSLNELIDIETYVGEQKTIQNSSAPIRNAEGRIVGAVIVNEDVTERVGAEKALRESASRLQHLSRRLLAVQEEERRHLSRELHDEFGQLLAAVTMHLHAAKSLAGEAAESSLEESIVLLQRAGAQMRNLALELRPTMLETAGLDATLRWLAEQHQERTGIATQVVGHLNDVSGDLAIACFRVAQEALTNVVRHARAQHVWIELSRSDGVLELVVRDDGVGFDVARTLDQAAGRGRLGLLGMKERVQILGGSLDVGSEAGRGTRIHVSLPSTETTPEPAESVT
jgi:PAS domain S-box-containing protein